MFAEVVLEPDTLDVGELAEALVYYKKVTVVLNVSQLFELVDRIGSDNLFRLVDREFLRIECKRTIFGCMENRASVYPYEFKEFSLIKTADGRRIRSAQDEIMAFPSRGDRQVTLSKSQLRRMAGLVEARNPASEVIRAGVADIVDEEYFLRGVRVLLGLWAPGYCRSGDVRAYARVQDNLIWVDSNIDFEKVNRIVAAGGKSEAHFRVDHNTILARFLEARSRMYHSGDRLCDLRTDKAVSALLVERVDSFLDRMERPRKQLRRFEEEVFAGRSFHRLFADDSSRFKSLVDLLERNSTAEFKKWLSRQKPAKELLREYDRAVMSESALFASLPVKMSKMLFFTGAGALVDWALAAGGAGTAAGLAVDVALNAGDEFLWSKFDSGWKPNQWVRDDALPFLTSK